MSGCLEQDSLYVGQDWRRTVPLRVDGLPYDATGASVEAQFVSIARTTATINGAVVSCTDTGLSNYAAGVVEVVYVDAVTSTLAGGEWTLEIAVTEAGGDKKIFHATPSVTVIPTGQAS